MPAFQQDTSYLLVVPVAAFSCTAFRVDRITGMNKSPPQKRYSYPSSSSSLPLAMTVTNRASPVFLAESKLVNRARAVLSNHPGHAEACLPIRWVNSASRSKQ